MIALAKISECDFPALPILAMVLATSFAVFDRAQAQTGGSYVITRNRIASGGQSKVTGGDLRLTATVGQHDTGILSGGDYALAGGFWAGTSILCNLPGDVNLDGVIDGLDIQPFVECLLGGGANCACADMTGDNMLTPSDVPPFVAALLDP